MSKTREHTGPALGTGVYTIPDIALLFRIPNYRVNRWINKFWDDKLGREYKTKYSWNVDLTRAVDFHTLVELYTFLRLSEAGVKPAKILEAHKTLSTKFRTKYPFANQKIVGSLRTDGLRVLFDDNNGNIYSLDKKLQYHLNIIRLFFKNLEFGTDDVATRLWPIGKEKSIVCDPTHQFGQPVIDGTNILAELIADMYKAGDSVGFISKTYGLTQKQIQDAIAYAAQAA